MLQLELIALKFVWVVHTRKETCCAINFVLRKQKVNSISKTNCVYIRKMGALLRMSLNTARAVLINSEAERQRERERERSLEN